MIIRVWTKQELEEKRGIAMSKERLEEIKYELYILHNCSNTKEEIKDFIFNHLKIEWLIEQAEQLHGTEHMRGRKQAFEECNKDYAHLNEKVKKLEEHILFNQSIENEWLQELLKENKKYRRAINYVITAKKGHYDSAENAIEDFKTVINITLTEDDNHA